MGPTRIPADSGGGQLEPLALALSRWSYSWDTLVVDLHHCITHPESVLSLCSITCRVGAALPFEVVEAEAFLGNDDAGADCELDEALQGGPSRLP